MRSTFWRAVLIGNIAVCAAVWGLIGYSKFIRPAFHRPGLPTSPFALWEHRGKPELPPFSIAYGHWESGSTLTIDGNIACYVPPYEMAISACPHLATFTAKDDGKPVQFSRFWYRRTETLGGGLIFAEHLDRLPAN